MSLAPMSLAPAPAGAEDELALFIAQDTREMPEPNMIPSPHKADDPAGVAPSRPGARAANVHGFLALLLIALFLGFIWSLRAPRRSGTGDFLFESIVLLLLYSGSWLFAIGGTRRGAGAGR